MSDDFERTDGATRDAWTTLDGMNTTFGIGTHGWIDPETTRSRSTVVHVYPENPGEGVIVRSTVSDGTLRVECFTEAEWQAQINCEDGEQ